MLGRVTSVRDEVAGTALAVDAPAGSGTIEVISTSDLLLSGTLSLGTELHDYTAVDLVTKIVTLADTTAILWYEGSEVHPVPAGTVRYIDVLPSEPGDSPGVVSARVPNVFADRLPLGTREQGKGEYVTIEKENDGWVFVDTPGAHPVQEVASRIVAGDLLGMRAELTPTGLFFFDETGELTGALQGALGALSLSGLYVADLSSPSTIKISLSPQTFYVNPSTGNDNWSGAFSIPTDTDADGINDDGPLLTLQRAIDSCPRYSDHDISILIASGSTLQEAVSITGFLGAGLLTIDGQNKTGTILSGSIIVDGCSMQINIRGFTVEDDGSGSSDATCRVTTSRYIDFDLVIKVGSKKPNGIRITAGSQCSASNCDIRGSNSEAMRASSASILNVGDCVGKSNGSSLNALAAIIFIHGSIPPGGTATGNGGQIFGSAPAVASPPGSDGGAKTTKYWKCTDTASWRDSGYGWRSDNDYVYQSGWSYGHHRGLWFYDHADLRSVLAGKTIDSAQIYVKRRSEGGTSAAQELKLHRHNYGSQPAGTPDLTNGSDIGSLKWGETKWLTVPVGHINAIRGNTAKGVGLKFDDPSYEYERYVLCEGKANLADSGKLKITYH